MATIQVKEYTRKSKYGKVVRVKSYSRNHTRTRSESAPPRSSSEDGKGKEYEERKAQRPPLSRDEALKREAELGYDRFQDYGRPGEHKRKGYSKTEKPQPVKEPTKKEKQDVFARLESKIARVVDKYSKIKYKKIM